MSFDKKSITSIRRISDVSNKSKVSKEKSNLAQAQIASILSTKALNKKLDNIFKLIEESNENDTQNIDNYLILSCMYYIKKKYSLALGILYKAIHIDPRNEHIKGLIKEIEEKLVKIETKKREKK